MTEPTRERDARILSIAEATAAAGGRALLVGGSVRDRLLGRHERDVDIEVLGLSLDALEQVLSRFGRVVRIGRSYSVLRLRGLDVDWSADEGAARDFAEVSRRRDLTINSIAIDALSGDVLDPHDGRGDLARKRLRATDPATFGRDPLRALRVARFAACLGMEPDDELIELCRVQPLADVPGERLQGEFEKLLVEAERPSVGFEVLERCGQLDAFPEIGALAGVPQDPRWHPEGDVWVHTKLVLDAAARLRRGDDDDFALMLGALCHDFGKPAATTVDEGRVRAHQHERAGVAPTESFLRRLRASNELVLRVSALVRHHLAPSQFIASGAGARAYRRLARQLERGGVRPALLERLARADHLGRTTADAAAGLFAAGDRFLERIEELALGGAAPADVVQGRHVLARGVTPGPEVGRILQACRERQDERGEHDPQAILDAVLGAHDARRPGS